MASPPAAQRSREHLEDLLFAVDAARSSVVLHVKTANGSGEFSIARGVLRGAAYGDAAGAEALRAVLEAPILSYQVHQVTEPPLALDRDGKEMHEGPRLSELLTWMKPAAQERSGFYMRTQLFRTSRPLPSDLPPLELLIAMGLGQGTSPVELVSELKAKPEDFLKALGVLSERGLVSAREESAASKSFSATMQSEKSSTFQSTMGSTLQSTKGSTLRTVGGIPSTEVVRRGAPLGGVTLLGGSPTVPRAPGRAQPDVPASSKAQNLMSRTQMAGSFASLDLAEPATLRDQAPPEGVNRARALAATISLASEQDDAPLPSGRFEAEILEELGGLNRAIHSSRKPALRASDEVTPVDGSQTALPVVGRYEVLARIKSGGVGSVYLCRLKGSSGFQRLFAMKVLRVGVVHDALLVREFFREARVLSTLHHPNVISIVDAGSEKEPYLVLDYVEGGSLFELCQASPEARDPAVVVTILLDALAGTSAVHQATNDAGEPLQLVHHDLTPHNLLVGVDGACRVADFGVARVGAAKVGEKQYGKPAYVAPERYLGAPDDHRSDLFSLGVVLYSGLTAVNPFQGANAEDVRSKVLAGKVPPASTVGLRPPPCFDWICERALAADPNDRFQSAEEMMVQLRRIAAREELLASPSQVAQWVRSVFHERLEARRKLLRPTQPPPPNGGEVAPEAQFETAEAQLRTISSPPSSYASHEKTEALPSSGSPIAPDEPVVPKIKLLALPTNRGELILYISLACAVLVLALIFLAPNWVRSFSTDAPQDASALKPAKVEPKIPAKDGDAEKSKRESDVVIPEIRPAGK